MTSTFNEEASGVEDAVSGTRRPVTGIANGVDASELADGNLVRVPQNSAPDSFEEDANEKQEGNTVEEDADDDFGEFEVAKGPEADNLPFESPLIEPDAVIPSIVDRPSSPGDSVSTPDDTPSLLSSGPSSPTRGVLLARRGIRPSLSSPSQSFERRFQARTTSSPLPSPRPFSPGFLTSQSRQSSVSSQLTYNRQEQEDEEQSPWEVVRWSKLKKITAQAFSEAGKRAFGRPTYFTIAASIVVGTSKGIVLVFDYQQTLKSIIGQGTKATEAGSVTSLAISADHSCIASGHADGSIFVWDLAHPARPFLHIPPMATSQLVDRNTDGHVSGFAILHVGFLGTRRTALVSADESGMAFSHVASRSLAVVTRNIKSTRILGRYPEPRATKASRKPSSVLAFAPLPLGNTEQRTDDMGLTALLTPHLLVIVSTTPIAQTQYKTPRSKDVLAHSTLSGCLAWFPAVKLRNQPLGPSQTSKTKLVYCWSNILTVLEVDSVDDGSAEDGQHPSLEFRQRSKWTAEEAIVSVQWLSRSVLAVLTITQKLFIIEDGSMRVADMSDLIQKHIYKQDLYSRQLQPLVDQLENDVSMHGVVADAFQMSFRAYKGRLFVLGISDVSMGTLSNWADRLMTLMDSGDCITAVLLATAYYTGETDRLTVGLPEDDHARHEKVEERLVEIMMAALTFVFKDVDPENVVPEMECSLIQLATASFAACVSMKNLGFLFDEVYEWYSNARVVRYYFDSLEQYILEDKIISLPPTILQDMMNYYSSQNSSEHLESIILHLDTTTMDIDWVTSMCKRHGLYDALISVWNNALGDYTTPAIELFDLVKDFLNGQNSISENDLLESEPSEKLVPYLAYTLTGRRYPDGADLPERDQVNAKADLYGWIFSEAVVDWPIGHGKLIRTTPEGSSEPSYPYLRLLLQYDAENFLSMLNEAFVESFLNESQDRVLNGDTPDENPLRRAGLAITRQRIINILLGVMTPPDFTQEETIYLDIFVARNVAKFPAFVLLRGSILRRTLEGLCDVPHKDMAEECQLSVEYLLSVYNPADQLELVPLYTKAGFYRVVKAVYKGSQQYVKWAEAHFEDASDRLAVFECLRECFRNGSKLSAKQVREVKSLIIERAADLVGIDSRRAAATLRSYAPDIFAKFLDRIPVGTQQHYEYLHELFEPDDENIAENSVLPDRILTDYTEVYVRLMCIYDRSRVVSYVDTIKSANLRLDEVLPVMESYGVIDAAIVLLARDGLVRDAMTRLMKYMDTLRIALVGLLTVADESPDARNASEAEDDLVELIRRYIKLGIWLCQAQKDALRAVKQPAPKSRSQVSMADVSEEDLEPGELLWLDLLDTVVHVSRAVTATYDDIGRNQNYANNEHDSKAAADDDEATSVIHQPLHGDNKASDAIRELVQATFTALLISTTGSAQQPGNEAHMKTSKDMSFLRILRAFLERASRSYPSLADLRSVLGDIFAAYTYEERMLLLSNQLLDKDVFVRVEAAHAQRTRGWRPRSQICEHCRKRTWGPGAGPEIWEAWKQRVEAGAELKAHELVSRNGGEAARSTDRGKGRARRLSLPLDLRQTSTVPVTEPGPETNGKSQLGQGPLVVFACSHVFHRSCFEHAQVASAAAGVTSPDQQIASAGINGRTEELHGDGVQRMSCPLCSSESHVKT